MGFPWKKIAKVGLGVVGGVVTGGPAGAIAGGGRAIFGMLGGDGDDDAQLFDTVTKKIMEQIRGGQTEAFAQSQAEAIITRARPDWAKRQVIYFAATALLEAFSDFEDDGEDESPPRTETVSETAIDGQTDPLIVEE